MKNKECLTCNEYKNCRNSFASWIFFIIGLIATIALRVITVLMHLNPVYGKMAWYLGVSGFFVFFVYKFRINLHRTKIINQREIVKKITDMRQLDKKDYEAIKTILCSLSSKKENINYLFIFGLSAIALVAALYMDVFK